MSFKEHNKHLQYSQINILPHTSRHLELYLSVIVNFFYLNRMIKKKNKYELN